MFESALPLLERARAVSSASECRHEEALLSGELLAMFLIMCMDVVEQQLVMIVGFLGALQCMLSVLRTRFAQQLVSFARGMFCDCCSYERS